jgi:serine/threonine protein kinase
MSEIMIGRRFEHYQVEDLIGKGGMGVVYRARDVRLGRPVALKVLKEEIMGDPDRKRRFMQEARSASAVAHPAIAQVYDVGEVDDTLYIALEFVEGETVRSLINSRELDLLAALEIAIQTAEGLGRAHSVGIVHRDIKSDNIMVTPDGRAKILDFGLAKLQDDAAGSGSEISVMETLAQTQAGTVMGTVAYMSPEQARGKVVDSRSDVFSLGIVIYEMATGELPFRGQSPLDTMHAIAFEEVRPVTVVRRDLPAELQRLLSRCLRKNPADRYQNAEALVTDLKRLKDNLESGSQRAVSIRERFEDWVEWFKYSLPSGGPSMAVLLVVAGLVGYLIFSEAGLGTIILILLIGLPVYRHIRNRRQRMVNRLVSKLSKIPEVRAVVMNQDVVNIVVDRAQASLFVRVNGLLESFNQKLFHGDPIEVAIRDDLSVGDFQQLLREPGVRYVRDEAMSSLPGPPPRVS